MRSLAYKPVMTNDGSQRMDDRPGKKFTENDSIKKNTYQRVIYTRVLPKSTALKNQGQRRTNAPESIHPWVWQQDSWAVGLLHNTSSLCIIFRSHSQQDPVANCRQH
jgi:hypothetical protein